MSHRPSSSPISWASSRYGYCLTRVHPNPDTGMYMTLHRNLSHKLRDHGSDAQKRSGKYNESAKYYAYVKLLQRQRQVPKTFTGEMHITNADAHAHVSRTVGERLHRAMNIYQPAESRARIRRTPTNENYLLNKPVYTRDEISNILDKLNSDEDEDRKNDVMKRFRKSQLYHAATSVREAIDEYVQSNTNKSKTIHRPFSARSCAHSSVPGQISRDVKCSERKHTKGDVNETSQRLYDDKKSDEDSSRTRRVKSAPPERCNSRKVNEAELDAIISRLASYDKTKWPPESRNDQSVNVYK